MVSQQLYFYPFDFTISDANISNYKAQMFLLCDVASRLWKSKLAVSSRTYQNSSLFPSVLLSCPVVSCPVLCCPNMYWSHLICPVLYCTVMSFPFLSCPNLSNFPNLFKKSFQSCFFKNLKKFDGTQNILFQRNSTN